MTQAGHHIMMGGKKWQNPFTTDGLIAMYDAEWNGGGGVHSSDFSKIVDSSGNGMDAVLSSASTSLPTYTDKGFAFNGGVAYGFQSGDALKAAYARQTLTLEIVAKVTGYTNTNRGLISIAPVSNNESSYNGNPYLRIYADGSYPEDGFYLANSSSYQTIFGQRFRRDLSINTPYGLSITMTRTEVKAYYNSILKSTENRAMIRTTQPTGGWIGAKIGSSAIYQACTGATIYNIRIYGKILTADEIAANHQIDKIRFGLT